MVYTLDETYALLARGAKPYAKSKSLVLQYLF